MWYFAWILGVGLAVLLAVVNAIAHDARQAEESGPGCGCGQPTGGHGHAHGRCCGRRE